MRVKFIIANKIQELLPKKSTVKIIVKWTAGGDTCRDSAAKDSDSMNKVSSPNLFLIFESVDMSSDIFCSSIVSDNCSIYLMDTQLPPSFVQ